MKKIWIWVAVVLMGLGTALFVGLGIMIDFDFTRLDNMSFVTNTYDITDAFYSIDIHTVYSNVELRQSEDGKCRVVCNEREKLLHDVSVRDGTLVIDCVDTRTWLDHINVFSFHAASITVYLAEGAYHALKVDNSTGDVNISGIWNVEKMSLEVTTGDIYVNGISCSTDAELHVTTGEIKLDGFGCKNLKVRGTTGRTVMDGVWVSQKLQLSRNTGDVLMSDCSIGELCIDGTTGGTTLRDVIVSGALRVEQSTGDMKLERCDAGELFLKSTTGSITASLRTEKQISAKTTTGKVDVPQFSTGGKCEIHTTTGDITVSFV